MGNEISGSPEEQEQGAPGQPDNADAINAGAADTSGGSTGKPADDGAALPDAAILPGPRDETGQPDSAD